MVAVASIFAGKFSPRAAKARLEEPRPWLLSKRILIGIPILEYSPFHFLFHFPYIPLYTPMYFIYPIIYGSFHFFVSISIFPKYPQLLSEVGGSSGDDAARATEMQKFDPSPKANQGSKRSYVSEKSLESYSV